MFLIKDKEVCEVIDRSPLNVYHTFAEYLHKLSETKLTVQHIWLIFLSLHGFVTHYLKEVENYEEVEALANAHVEFLLSKMDC